GHRISPNPGPGPIAPAAQHARNLDFCGIAVLGVALPTAALETAPPENLWRILASSCSADSPDADWDRVRPPCGKDATSRDQAQASPQSDPGGIEPITKSAATIKPHNAMVTGLLATTRIDVSRATAAPTSRSSSKGKGAARPQRRRQEHDIEDAGRRAAAALRRHPFRRR